VCAVGRHGTFKGVVEVHKQCVFCDQKDISKLNHVHPDDKHLRDVLSRRRVCVACYSREYRQKKTEEHHRKATGQKKSGASIPLNAALSNFMVPGLRHMIEVFHIKYAEPDGMGSHTVINRSFLEQAVRTGGDEQRILQMCFDPPFSFQPGQPESSFTPLEMQQFFELLCTQQYSALSNLYGFDAYDAHSHCVQ
jgi:hypothetical protein